MTAVSLIIYLYRQKYQPMYKYKVQSNVNGNKKIVHKTKNIHAYAYSGLWCRCSNSKGLNVVAARGGGVLLTSK
jgi:hypothetical protein